MFETGFLRLIAWAILASGVVAFAILFNAGSPLLISGAVLAGGLAVGSLLLAFAGIAENVQRLADHLTPEARVNGRGVFKVPEQQP